MDCSVILAKHSSRQLFRDIVDWIRKRAILLQTVEVVFVHETKLESVFQEGVMWLSMRLVVASLATFSIGVSWLGAQQPPDARNTQKDSPAGKVAWQYDTGG
jgi:hypothetical protein